MNSFLDLQEKEGDPILSSLSVFSVLECSYFILSVRVVMQLLLNFIVVEMI